MVLTCVFGRLVTSPECAMDSDTDTIFMGKFMLTHAGFLALVMLLFLATVRPNDETYTEWETAPHSTNAAIALWTITLGKKLFLSF